MERRGEGNLRRGNEIPVLERRGYENEMRDDEGRCLMECEVLEMKFCSSPFLSSFVADFYISTLFKA